MHVHLPKPLHGWREFFGEVGIIVVGVVVALGLEQLVEIAHWDHKVEQARGAIRAEIGVNYAQAAELAMVGSCVDSQLRSLETGLLSRRSAVVALSRDPVSGLTFTFRAPSRTWSRDVWQSVVTEGVSSHLESDLRAELANFELQTANMESYSEEANLLGWKLKSLAVPMVRDPATKARLVEEIEEERGRFGLMTLVAGQLMADVVRMKMTPSRQDVGMYLAQSGTVKFCRAHQLPLGAIPVPG